MVHTAFPDYHQIENVLTGAIRSGQLLMANGTDGEMWLSAARGLGGGEEKII